ncbi:hypothetical protein ccbrp13_17690 [Ktedonobacteria bacterium brp13]|nr:hypothetical protein ccbrp13_17690 [Ktedonobacteria bacterium brp13]
MNNLRRFEAACGFFAALLGFLGLAYVLFSPTYSFAGGSVGGSEQSGTGNLLQVGIQPITLVFFCIFLLGLIGVVTGAVLHSRTGENGWRALLWVSTLAMVACTILALLSIWAFLFPSTLFALFACMLSLRARRVALS